MARILGVNAAGWHELLQYWWQFVSNALENSKEKHHLYCLDTCRIYSRFCGPGIDFFTLPGMSELIPALFGKSQKSISINANLD